MDVLNFLTQHPFISLAGSVLIGWILVNEFAGK